MKGGATNLCPPNNFGGFGYAFSTNCASMYDDWTSWTFINSNGGLLNRGILEFGGGHNDYYGNELYWLDRATGVKTRITNPSDPTPNLTATCGTKVDPYADGRPSARHSYGAFTHLSAINKVMIYSGITSAPPGCGDGKIFFLDEASLTGVGCASNCSPAWSQPTLTGTGCPSALSQNWAYVSDNPYTGNAYIFLPADDSNSAAVNILNPRTLVCNRASRGGTNASKYWGTVVDPIKQIFLIIGDVNDTDGGNYKGFLWCDTTPGTDCNSLHFIPPANISASCSAITSGKVPAVWWDVTHRQAVAYPGNGNTIYIPVVNKVANTVACGQESYGSVEGTSFPERFNCIGCINDPANTGSGAPMLRKVVYDEAADAAVFDMNPDTTAWILKRWPIMTLNNSGGALTNVPVTFGHGFAKGEISNFPQAFIAGTGVTTQVDQVKRWSDGSVKHAVISFIVPSFGAAGSVDVQFQNQGTGNNLGFETQAAMLGAGYNFDAQIQSGSFSSISARAILAANAPVDNGSDLFNCQNGSVRRYLSGPIVTGIIIEDCSAARSLDVKVDGLSGNPLHPIFEAWFYPSTNQVDVVYTLENPWSSSNQANSMRDQSYGFNITGGNVAPLALFTQASFNHIGGSLWRKWYCINGVGAGSQHGCNTTISVDHNMPYEAYSGIIPNYDPGILLAASQITANVNGFNASNQTIPGGATSICLFQKDLDAGGTDSWVGVLATWEVLYLFSQADPASWNVVLGCTDLVGRVPYHYREADSVVGGTNLFFDAGGTVNPVGRMFSVNARPQESIGRGPGNENNVGNGFNDPCGGSNVLTYTFGTVTTDGWSTDGMDPSHWLESGTLAALFTGKYSYMMEAAYNGFYMEGWGGGCPGGRRHGNLGLLNQSQNGRGNAWSERSVATAWVVTPDSSPEHIYLADKLANSAVYLEGTQSYTNSDLSRASVYAIGVSAQDSLGPNPLHFFPPYDNAFVQFPVDTTGSVINAGSPWEEGYLQSVWAQARDWELPNWGNLLSVASSRIIHSAIDPNAGGIYMIGLYRMPQKILRAGNTDWVRTYNPDYRSGFTNGNGSGIPNSWVFYHPCANSPEDDHWRAAPQAQLAFSYGYSLDGLSGARAFDVARLSQWATGGCLPGMFNDPVGTPGANPKWDIWPRRLIQQTGTLAPPTNLKVTPMNQTL
jgi:hypothetical protein